STGMSFTYLIKDIECLLDRQTLVALLKDGKMFFCLSRSAERTCQISGLISGPHTKPPKY
ncbi:MAG: hypothetical protein ACREGF_04375, partial [Candidatus Saccharimonadales bacterium]